MCLVGYRRRSSLVSLAAASLILDDGNAEKEESSAQDLTAAKVLNRPAPMTTELLPNAKRTFCEQEATNPPSYSRQITNSPEPRCYKKRKPSFIDGVDEEIKNATRISSSAFLLSFPDDADSNLAANSSCTFTAPPSKRARTLAFRKSTTMMTYESVKSSLFSCGMLPPSI